MNILTGDSVIKALKEGDIIYLHDSDAFEKRYYRMKSDSIEYKDADNDDWKISKLNIEDIKKQSWVVLPWI